MPYNGSGTFTPYTPGNPVITGTTISSSAFNSTMSDLAAGLTNAVTRDGQSPPTANLPMGGRKHTGLAAGTVPGDSLRWEQLFSQGIEQDIASAATTDIGGLNTTFAQITGTTTITSFGTNYNGPRFVRFAGSLTLTHNASTLILPTGANITTAAGDRAILTPVGNPASGWQVLAYQTANGRALADLLNTLRINVASATTVDLTANAPSTRNINITGTTQIDGFTVVAGQLYFVRFNAALVLSNNSAIVTQTGAAITTSAGATCILRATAANTVEVLCYVDPTPDVQAEIQPIAATVGSNALTITLNPTTLSFRSTTLGSGAVSTGTVLGAITLTVPSGATLGTTNGALARLAVLAINNAGTVELAVVNLGGGVNLNESGVISTTSMSGSSNSISTIYSTTARSNVAYRIVGFIEITEATAGTWATAPSLVNGSSNPLAVWIEGYGQRWQNMLGQRAVSTPYSNTSGRTIHINVSGSLSASNLVLIIDGVSMSAAQPGTSTISLVTGRVRHGSTYQVNYSGTIDNWSEER